MLTCTQIKQRNPRAKLQWCWRARGASKNAARANGRRFSHRRQDCSNGWRCGSNVLRGQPLRQRNAFRQRCSMLLVPRAPHAWSANETPNRERIGRLVRPGWVSRASFRARLKVLDFNELRTKPFDRLWSAQVAFTTAARLAGSFVLAWSFSLFTTCHGKG